MLQRYEVRATKPCGGNRYREGHQFEKSTYLAKPGKDETRMLCCLETLLTVVHSFHCCRVQISAPASSRTKSRKGKIFAGKAEIGEGD